MSLSYHALDEGLSLSADGTATHLVLLGKKEDIVAAAAKASSLVSRLLSLPSGSSVDQVDSLVSSLAEKLSPAYDSGSTVDTYVDLKGTLIRISLAALPAGPVSRHNAPSQPHAASDLIKGFVGGEGTLRVLLVLSTAEHAVPLGAAMARPFHLYSRKSTAKAPRKVDVIFSLPTAALGAKTVSKVTALAEGIQLTARLGDAPTNELHTDAFVEEVMKLSSLPKVGIEVIRGEELRDRGFGGIWGVGKASDHPPALVILSLNAEKKGAKSIVWVGKGIVYDTGGLSIKTKSGMPGMKRDMCGAAAVFAAFQAAAQLGYDKGPLYALLCLAENSVDSRAARPDDIHTMYSGKTVEINNTDAEGRLVLGDGVAYAVKHLDPAVVIDMATLTGAQGIATGKRHASIYCNDEGLEGVAVAVGRSSGDLVHPVPYCPEFFQPEFKSAVADMKNSVANRDNAQASCAGQFIGSHLGEWVKEGKWLHIDMASPAHIGDRSTGYGVALLIELLDKL